MEHEDAAHVLKNSGDNVGLIVDSNIEKFKIFEEKLKNYSPINTAELNQDSYLKTSTNSKLTNSLISNSSNIVKTLFDFNPEIDSSIPTKGLNLKFGDLLKIVDSNDEDSWRAKRLNDPKSEGLVPSTCRL